MENGMKKAHDKIGFFVQTKAQSTSRKLHALCTSKVPLQVEDDFLNKHLAKI